MTIKRCERGVRPKDNRRGTSSADMPSSDAHRTPAIKLVASDGGNAFTFECGKAHKKEKMTAHNGFERKCIGFNASTGRDVRCGSNTWHDDGEASVEVPDDGASVCGHVGDMFGVACFWPIAIDTVAQYNNAEDLCARHGLKLCSARVMSPVVWEYIHELHELAQQRANELAEHARMREASREANRRHKAETWCNPMAVALANV